MGKGTVFESASLGKKVGIGSVGSGSDRTSHDLSIPSPSREVAAGNCCRLCQDLDKGPVHVRQLFEVSGLGVENGRWL